MNNQNSPLTSIPLRALAVPLFAENFLRILIMVIDVWMLSAFSQKAVAAVGLNTNFMFFIQLLYQMVAIGTSIVVAQNLGANKKLIARSTSSASIILIGALGLFLSLLTGFGANSILSLYGLEPEVHEFAREFLTIYGFGSITVGFSILLGTILRVNGHPKTTMIVNIGMAVLNVLGNSLALFGWFGLPVTGVTGVAVATVVSQAAGAIAFWIILKKKPATSLRLKNFKQVKKEDWKDILAIGVPTAGENLSYNLSQIFNMKIIAMMGTEALTTYVYLISLLRFVFTPSSSIGMGTQTKVGWWVGAGESNTAYRKTIRYVLAGLGCSIVLIFSLNLFQKPLLSLYTHNAAIIALAGSVLLVALIHEPGRNLNLILIPALKGAGDVKFPVGIGILSMWIVGLGGSYLFGIIFGFGLTGVWIAMASDEWLRALIMIRRWKSGRWRNKSVVH